MKPVRAKVFQISAHRMLTATYGTTKIRGCGCLPAGFRVLQCQSAGWVHGGAVEILVEHESFPATIEGCVFPVNDCRCLLEFAPVEELGSPTVVESSP